MQEPLHGVPLNKLPCCRCRIHFVVCFGLRRRALFSHMGTICSGCSNVFMLPPIYCDYAYVVFQKGQPLSSHANWQDANVRLHWRIASEGYASALSARAPLIFHNEGVGERDMNIAD